MHVPTTDYSVTAPIRQLFFMDKTSRKAVVNMAANHYHHDAYEIYYLCSGERYYFIHDRTYQIHAGDLVFIQKNVIHRTLNLSTGHTRIVVNFQDDFFAGMPEVMQQWGVLSLFDKPILRLNRKQQAYVEPLLNRMMDEYENSRPDRDAYLKLLLTDLMLYAQRSRHELSRIVPEEKNETSNPMFERVSTVADYINSHYADPLSLEMLSGLFHINPFYLSRIFKKVTGFSFVEYVNQVRLKEAQKLLIEGSISITKIAGIVGFESLSHFGRVFKASTGMSPREFRKTYGIDPS